MSQKKGLKVPIRKLKAEVVEQITLPCSFCHRIIDDEISYGKQYLIGNVQCHYFCVLLSCCLIQKGKDSDGLFGFLYLDIIQEIERCKKHKCSYCSKEGANLGCSVSQCRKQFHLPCGKEKNAVSLFFGTYKTYCQNHVPKQKIPDVILANAKTRKRIQNSDAKRKSQDSTDEPFVCVICYEDVDAYPTPKTFWPPCCARDAWFHRRCIERMALNSGMHYLKCPLCNDKERFYMAVLEQGYYVPDRDAAWELEQNAFSEIYERQLRCNADECKCPLGRNHDAEQGMWDIQLCVLCGGAGRHVACARLENEQQLVCDVCQHANPTEQLLYYIATVPLTPERQERPTHGPVMPSRMSLRRTKQRNVYAASTSTDTTKEQRKELNLKSPKKIQNFLEPSILKGIENQLISPLKMFERGLVERLRTHSVDFKVEVDSKMVVERMRKRLDKPKPLSYKKKIINDIIDGLLSDVVNENQRSRDKEKNTPKKSNNKDTNEITQEKTPEKDAGEDCKRNEISEPSIDKEESQEKAQEESIEIEDDDSNSTFQLPSEFIAEQDSEDSLPIFDTPIKLKTVDIQKDTMEICEHDHKVSIDLTEMRESVNQGILNVCIKSPEVTEKCAFKFSPVDKETLGSKVHIDLEAFKSQYLTEVGNEFKCSFSHNHDDLKNSPVKIKTVIDFAKDAAKKNLKRKLDRKKKKSKKAKSEKEDSKESKVKLKIAFKNKEVRPKRDKRRRKKFFMKIKRFEQEKKVEPLVSKNLKQTVLQFGSPENVLKSPESKVIKKKNPTKSPDNLKQTTLQSFFKKI